MDLRSAAGRQRALESAGAWRVSARATASTSTARWPGPCIAARRRIGSSSSGRIGEPHVVRRRRDARQASAESRGADRAERRRARTRLQSSRSSNGWLDAGRVRLTSSPRHDRRLLVPVPPRFSDMQQDADRTRARRGGLRDSRGHDRPPSHVATGRSISTSIASRAAGRYLLAKASKRRPELFVVAVSAKSTRRMSFYPGGQASSAAQHVQVQVEHRLPGVRIAVEHRPEAALGVAAFGGDGGGAADHLADERVVIRARDRSTSRCARAGRPARASAPAD